jgi:hypothetical protein
VRRRGWSLCRSPGHPAGDHVEEEVAERDAKRRDCFLPYI